MFKIIPFSINPPTFEGVLIIVLLVLCIMAYWVFGKIIYCLWHKEWKVIFSSLPIAIPLVVVLALGFGTLGRDILQQCKYNHGVDVALHYQPQTFHDVPMSVLVNEQKADWQRVEAFSRNYRPNTPHDVPMGR